MNCWCRMNPDEWRGSGTLSYDIAIKVSCPNEKCDFDEVTDVRVDDWKKYWFDCPKCDFDDELKNDTPF